MVKTCAEPHCKKTVHNDAVVLRLRTVENGAPGLACRSYRAYPYSSMLRSSSVRGRPLFQLLWRSPHEVGHDVYREREDDGGVLLRGDARQGLEVAELGQYFCLYFCTIVLLYALCMGTGRYKHIYGNLTQVFF